jgi:eukaryotic-like serine/threonine-protein kinase
MGEVYRARDAKLNREVALKILSGAFTTDPDRLSRFRREAQVLASLNHPNIAAIYGFEDSGGTHALVLEMVEGQTLSDRIAEGPMALPDALPIARQIAAALEAAHDLGIVHRDLKPANIKVRGDGTVKVLDFGLAKAMDPTASSVSATAADSPTLTVNATAMGAIIGTAAYMAPEQARGKTVDKRADIWAFGAVLYEMLSGHAAFAGDTVTDILAAVVTREPDWAALPATTPTTIKRLLARCLDKDPKRRLRDIGDALPELELNETLTSAVGAGQLQRSRWWRAAPWIVATLLAVALAFSLAGAFGRTTDAGTPVRRFTIEIPSNSAPNWNDFGVAISTDGTQVAYNCREGNTVSLCVRALDSLTARRVAEGRDASAWFFSPDGEWIGIVDDVGLSKVSIRGGKPQSLLLWPGKEPGPVGFSWGSDNFILFGTTAGIQRVSASGGSAEPVTRIVPGSGIVAHVRPSLLPDGRSALITIVHADGSQTGGLVNMSDGSVRQLGIQGRGFIYLPPGWLAFQQGTTVFAAGFDPGDPRVVNPVPVIENVSTMLRAAPDGSLAYIPTRGESSARLVWVDRAGRPTAVEGERLDYTHLDLAPDERRALLNLAGGKVDLIDLQGGTRRLVAEGSFPIWSSNGERVTFSGRDGLYSAPADGSAPPELLVSHPGMVVPTSWNAVTGELAYYDHRAFEIWIRAVDGKTRRFLGAPGRKRSGRFSPDGRWVAFVSDETGEYQVYATAYPGPGPTVAVSTKGGLSPIWSADGRELFFRLGNKLLAARMSSQSPLGFTVPVELFDGPYTLDLIGHQREDVASNGQRFLMVENSDDFPIVIVQNWPREVARLVR